MTMHEALYFINEVHEFLRESCARKGTCCWPTREILSVNLMANRRFFPRATRQDMNERISRARQRGWIVEAPCAPECHARHVQITSVGLEALKLMNEHGCASEHQQAGRACVTEGFDLKREVA